MAGSIAIRPSDRFIFSRLRGTPEARSEPQSRLWPNVAFWKNRFIWIMPTGDRNTLMTTLPRCAEKKRTRSSARIAWSAAYQMRVNWSRQWLRPLSEVWLLDGFKAGWNGVRVLLEIVLSSPIRVDP